MKVVRLTGILIVLTVMFSCKAWGWIGFCGRTGGEHAPEVRYMQPRDEAVVDLSGKEGVIFSWKPTPIPSSGRECYKITIYKEFSYEVVFKRTLGRDVTSIMVPQDLFERGETYTWKVKQRAARKGAWSWNSRWSFKVEK